MLYAAKAHPEQKCDGLALTYASNTHKLEQLLDSSTIYLPALLAGETRTPGPVTGAGPQLFATRNLFRR